MNDVSAVDLLVRCGWLVTMGPRGIIKDGYIAISDGRIAALGQGEAGLEANETLDRRDHIIFPGLINTHVHLYQNLLKGLGHDLPLARWNREVIAPAAANLTEEDCRVAALGGCLEALRGGTTTLVEFMHNHPRPLLSDAIIGGAGESGIRLVFGRGYRDRAREPVFETMTEPVERAFVDVERLLSRFPADGSGLLAVALAPAGIRTGVSREGLAATAEFAAAHQLLVTMHVLESQADDRCASEWYGRTTTELLEETGLLGANLLAVHCCWAAPADISRFARTGTKVSHNPISNMILASGVCPVPELRRAGVVVSLGTDGAASNNALDMLETLKITALLHKTCTQDPAVLDAPWLLEAATLGGARALGREDELGSLEPGKRADFVVYDPLTARSAACHDPIATLVFSAGQEGVRDVFVGGRGLLREGRFEHVDERMVYRTLQRRAEDLARRSGGFWLNG